LKKTDKLQIFWGFTQHFKSGVRSLLGQGLLNFWQNQTIIFKTTIMKISAGHLLPVSTCLLLLVACGGSKQQNNAPEAQQKPPQPENTQTAPATHIFNINGTDVKGTIIIDTSENQNGPVVTDADTNILEGKNEERIRLQATKWHHEAIGIIPIKDGFNDLAKATEDRMKGNGDSFDVLEKGDNSLFYHCKIKVYDGKDLYGFLIYVKGKNKGYELYCDGNYTSTSSGIAEGFIEEKDDAMKAYKIAQTFKPAE